MFAFLWAGAAAIAFWHSTPPSGAAFMFWGGVVVAGAAGYVAAKIRRLRPRRRTYLALGIVCLALPFGLAALFGWTTPIRGARRYPRSRSPSG